MPVSYLPVKNNGKRLVCLLSRGPQGREEFVWQSKGEDNSVLEVPDYITGTVDFRRQLQKGVLSIMSTEEYNSIQAPASTWMEKDEASRQAILDSMDRSPLEVFVDVECIIPEGGKTCGVKVPVRKTQLGDRPPLCERHAHLEGNCVLVSDENAPDDGKEHLVWKVTQVAVRTNNGVPSGASNGPS